MASPLRIFLGYDPNQAVAFSVCQFSIERRASVPVAITPLKLDTLPIKRRGLTEFTFSRFLVPWLCDFQGEAIFLDSDFLVRADIAMIPVNWGKAVTVSKNPKRFEWPSLMAFNCAHRSLKGLTPEYIETADNLHLLNWLPESEIGALPSEWNHLVGYDPPRTDAKAVHFTQGMPYFPETEGSEYAAEWREEHRAMNATKSWLEVMGNSIHAASTKDGRKVARLHKDAMPDGPT